MFRVTQEWLEEFRTDEGGYTRDQLQQLGVGWPPPKGWKRRATGLRIKVSQRKRFELRLDRRQV